MIYIQLSYFCFLTDNLLIIKKAKIFLQKWTQMKKKEIVILEKKKEDATAFYEDFKNKISEYNLTGLFPEGLFFYTFLTQNNRVKAEISFEDKVIASTHVDCYSLDREEIPDICQNRLKSFFSELLKTDEKGNYTIKETVKNRKTIFFSQSLSRIIKEREDEIEYFINSHLPITLLECVLHSEEIRKILRTKIAREKGFSICALASLYNDEVLIEVSSKNTKNSITAFSIPQAINEKLDISVVEQILLRCLRGGLDETSFDAQTYNPPYFFKEYFKLSPEIIAKCIVPYKKRSERANPIRILAEISAQQATQ